MVTKTQQISIEDYNYSLPDERIAKFPLPKRDESKLLLYRDGKVSESVFKHITDYLPEGSLMVFNNTRVIQARLLFQRATGAQIEVFCLDPAAPHDYELIFQQTEACNWICLIGNAKKWKEPVLSREITVAGQTVRLSAEKVQSYGETHQVRFSWDGGFSFAEVLDAAGELPIPPYLHRKTEESDLKTYQTVYSKIKGSVAAPTAGLHFTPEVLADLDAKGFGREELTLHVGAGTFKPVKSETIEGHEMHTEYISVRRSTIERVMQNFGKIIAVGTTSVRTLESLYYIGVTLATHPDATSEELVVRQWMPYEDANNRLTPTEALQNILDYLDKHQLNTLITATQIIIAPGYEFKVVKGIVTNFHQPKSTLLLLISAFVKGDWKNIYDYALGHDFRFLSYGDSSLLL
ncbi:MULTISPECIES: S-adenosylmethionine:tRNA ribosyltransferase-isomerase [Parabacteroides]|jgi:S-adenosylmethionine:tRNA ribosyltransferase-isomerase|uniref:S-adenosylmethionine:tRNA ribosyltransferase-isomerase n=2 Tax=Parabacteroides goldsteinii TaxID=328812 RepID=S0GR46_9BACT|nr:MULTISPECIES: S-adenosylmethionine:tRNA ribosyltransferase-isomerase [Parabacteroides]EOS17240.1 S-adenosylmethionine:tRNA ribosyltransferase-isomerase [Parabacteroides goldsteinii dnLKV18]KAI4359488.1 S-adenosylmethionine:tRNA ribosyltransferase-isomerase [Parabacteroides sp. ASF519]MBF0763875.1 S-adenosylmethionine:tRNA ribosyltransferase-isomerase [Parabacteroides goldsteinii]MDZ3927416.1 S-adenosylmethionine:tRNA ribosyltransferase-isomerase [Parabacteroides goldsteinii]NBI93786.1 S-ade